VNNVNNICFDAEFNQGDTLADILKTIRLQAQTIYCHDLASPWGISLDQQNQGLFHIVISGSCWLKTPEMQHPIRLDTGDIIALPTGGAHWLSDMPETPKQPGEYIVNQLAHNVNPFACCDNKENNVTVMLCGSFNFATSLQHPFLRDLPNIIHIKAAENPELAWLQTLMKVLAYEAKSKAPGSTVIVDRLTEILFIQLIRAYIATKPQGTCYFTALADQQIGQALNLIHGEQKAVLTVEKLCQLVAMSRTAFTERFSKLVGMAPKAYLLNWRMHKAKNLLEMSSDPMIEIAETVGYSSEAAFSKAFKQFFNITPGQTRRLANH
jgi:AraC-like DNA-binding protein